MGRALVAAMAVLFLGCGGQDEGGAADMAVANDLSMAPDLSPLLDLATIAYGDGAVACIPAGGSVRAQYVWNNVLVPMQRTDYAIDLNGDGRNDNQLGNIEGALAGQGLPVQTQATQAVQSGQSL